MTLPNELLIRYSTIADLIPEWEATQGAWLGPNEGQELARLGDRGRRQQWLAGRWLSKQLARQVVDLPDLARLDVLTRNQGRGARPRLLLDGSELPWALSIAHSDRGAMAALAPSGDFSVGLDLAQPIDADERFRRLWFSAAEIRWLEADPIRRTTVLWVIKEAAYKAAQAGDTWNPREIEVLLSPSGSVACWYQNKRLRQLAVQLSQVDGHVAAIVCLARESRKVFRAQVELSRKRTGTRFAAHQFVQKSSSVFVGMHHD